MDSGDSNCRDCVAGCDSIIYNECAANGYNYYSKANISIPDMVNRPPHYNNYNTEVIDVLKACLTDEQYKGYLLGNMLKYRLRAGFKNANVLDRDDKRAEDLKKSNWYQDRMFAFELDK